MKFRLALSFLLVLIVFPISLVKAETEVEVDEWGYEYTLKKASEIDFLEEDFYVVSLSEELPNEDTIFAVYDHTEVEKFEQSLFPFTSTFSTFSSLPTKFSEYYTSSSKWIVRNGVISLSLYPKKPAYDTPPGMAQAHLQKYRWSVVYDKYKNSPNWKNTASMKAQLECHANIPKNSKTPWNLEPHRTETNYWKVVQKGCNP